MFGINTFEITELSEEALANAEITPGHYTIKVDPLTNKELLHNYGFYYTDTLIQPTCWAERLNSYHNAKCTVREDVVLEQILPMCIESFLHGRFHRDFNLPEDAADQRYKQWLAQLHSENSVFGLYYQGETAGFIAQKGGYLTLHAIAEQFRGQGLAKYFWSEVCNHIFQSGINEIHSSVSSSNMPVLNLYASLGFHFHNPVDIYHRLTR